MTRAVSVAATGLAVATSAHAEMSPEELAKMTQNPVANLISVPFQNNTNFNVGPQKGTQNILNIQPVIPITLNENWNLITRTILPVISQPPLTRFDDRVDGLGDLQFSTFLSPANAEGLIWGAGAIVQAATNTSSVLGNERWGLGPTAVVLKLEKGNPWVYGVLVNNVWSVSNSGSSPSYSNFLMQPFLNYNFPDGTYLTSSPIVTANWQADGKKWTVPLGGGIGHIFHLGPLPVNTQLNAFYYVARTGTTARAGSFAFRCNCSSPSDGEWSRFRGALNSLSSSSECQTDLALPGDSNMVKRFGGMVAAAVLAFAPATWAAGADAAAVKKAVDIAKSWYVAPAELAPKTRRS